MYSPNNHRIKCFLNVLFAFFLTACQGYGGLSIDTQGPEVEFQMLCDSSKISTIGDGYYMIAQSDTVSAISIEDYLSEVGQTHNAIIEKAELKNSFLTINCDSAYLKGVSAVRIEVQPLGSKDNRRILFDCQELAKATNITLDNCAMTPSEIFSLIEKGYVAYLCVAFADHSQKTLQDSTVFDFVSGTVIGIKVRGGALLDFDL